MTNLLAKALLPFAEVVEEWAGEPDNLEVELKAYDWGGPSLFVADFRYAAHALAAYQSEPKPAMTNLLAEALQKLANEVDGLNFRAGEIVEAIGRTNWETLQLRLRGARSALAAYQPALEEKDEHVGPR